MSDAVKDRDEVIKALDAALTNMVAYSRFTLDEVYELEDCARDALDLLRAQEPRVMTRDEAFGSRIIEYKHDGATDGSFEPGVVVEEHPLNSVVDVVGYGDKANGTACVEFSGRSDDPEDVIWHPVDEYGKTWRCWTGLPTDEQRRETAWEEDGDE